jgi:hypothetical protein
MAEKVVGAVATEAVEGDIVLAPFIFTRTRCPMSAVVRVLQATSSLTPNRVTRTEWRSASGSTGSAE